MGYERAALGWELSDAVVDTSIEARIQHHKIATNTWLQIIINSANDGGACSAAERALEQERRALRDLLDEAYPPRTFAEIRLVTEYLWGEDGPWHVCQPLERELRLFSRWLVRAGLEGE